MSKVFKGHKYWGELVEAKEALKKYNYVISSNGPQGPDGNELVESLIKFKCITVYLDIEEIRDNMSDTIFIEFNDDASVKTVKLVNDIIFRYRPDEYSFNKDLSVLRVWWD